MNSAVERLRDFIGEYPSSDEVARPLILIPTFNNPTYVRGMIRQLEARGLDRYLLLDGGSTLEDMRTLLVALEGSKRVIRFPDNPGPAHFARFPEFYRELPRVFCVTDPDLEFNDQMPRRFLRVLYGISNELKVGKVGLALDIGNAEQLRSEHFLVSGQWHTIESWESRFWQDRVESKCEYPVYRAAVDTTFALYNKDFFNTTDFLEAVRVAGPFSATHLPWLRHDPRPILERDTYLRTQEAGEFRETDALHRELQRRIEAMEATLSWRITSPLRGLKDALRRTRRPTNRRV